MLKWDGFDNGQEGLLRRDQWFKVLEVLYAHQGENHTDSSSGVFVELKSTIPERSWQGSDRRSFFRDYAKAWTKLGVLRSTADTDGFIELTTAGKELVEHPENLTEFYRDFVDHYLERWEIEGNGVHIAPFLLIASALIDRPSFSRGQLQDYVQEGLQRSLDLDPSLGFADDVKARNINARRFGTYLIILNNALSISSGVKTAPVVTVDDIYLKSLQLGIPPTLTAPKHGVIPEVPWDEDRRSRVPGQRTVREGQEAFKESLMEAYGRRCAMTGSAETRVLEAAHIMPYMGRHTNSVKNGILLSVDVHRLFDQFLISVDPNTLEIHTHDSVLDNRYKNLDGKIITTPVELGNQPDNGALRHHFEEFSRLAR